MTLPRHLLAGALAAAIAAAVPAAAAPITASEPPDFPDFFQPQSLGTLDIGANTITGGLSFSATFCNIFGCAVNGDRDDGFAVMLAAGHRITSISATISGFMSPGGPNALRLDTFIDATTLPIFLNNIITGNGSQQFFTGAVDGAGDLAFGFRSTPDATGSYRFNYVITVLVEAAPQPPPPTPVPEPATLALFGLGLAGLVAARRRRPA